jgi:hypothetical protein
VPVGRWCNRCGARLEVAVATPRRHVFTRAGIVRAVTAGLLALVVTVAGELAPRLEQPGRSVHGDVPLPDVGALLDPSAFEPYTVTVEATLACSDRIMRVSVADIGDAEVGELVSMAVGPCVVHARPQAGRAGIGTASLAR